MKTICRYSGVEFEAPGFKHLRAPSKHPIFNVDTVTLLNLFSEQWTWGKLNEEESKLLFLAMLNATDLTRVYGRDGRLMHDRWEVIARPAPETVAAYMEPLYKFLVFKDAVTNPTVMLQDKFPTYTINPTTATLKNIKILLERWEECKQDWKDRGQRQRMNERLASHERSLEKLIKSTYLTESERHRRTDVLAKWAMIASNAPNEKRARWISLFKIDLSGIEIYDPRYRNDFSEAFEWISTHLDAAFNNMTAIHAHAAIKHLGQRYEKNSKGLMFGLDSAKPLDSWSFADFKEHAGSEGDGGVEQDNIDKIVATAPSSEPKQEDFRDLPTHKQKIAYLTALAAWRVASAERAKMTAVEVGEEEKLREAERLRLELKEDSEAGEEPIDHRQLGIDWKFDDTHEDSHEEKH